MFLPKITIIKCLNFSSYKETAVLDAIIIININLFIFPCIRVCIGGYL
jgi:hypothetical protein